MNNTLRSTTLIALAAGAFAADTVAPPTQVPVVPLFKDSSLKLTIGGQFQFRADWNQARSSDDKPFDTTSGTPAANDNSGAKSDDLDFYLRRCRLFVNGTYGDYSLKFGIRADNADKTTNAGATSGRAFEIHYASITRKWSGSATHYLQLGLDYAFFNSASFGSSSAHLFPAARATEGLLAPRGTGIGYRVDAGPIYFGVDVQNNNKVLNATGDEASTTSSAYQSEGLCYTGRIEFTPTGDWAIKPKDYKEAWAGKTGKGWMVGLEAGFNHHDTETKGTSAGAAEFGRWRDTLVVGAESLLHLDNLSALIEYRWVRQTANSDRGELENNVATSGSIGDNPRYCNIFVIQAGYALPCMLISGAVIEPVARYTNLDYNRDGQESASFGSGSEYAAASASGDQYDLGVNWYPSPGYYNNKVSVLYTHWLGEEDRGDSALLPAGNNDSTKPKADIVRVQYQWLF